MSAERAESDPRRRERRTVAVRGIVQGVGFRPFIYALACRHGLAGWVRNDAKGVRIEVEGPAERLDLFLAGIRADAPPLAVVEAIDWRTLAGRAGERGFRIIPSRGGERRLALVSPDVTACAACLAELFDPADRRYRYPFINCTHCGPRFTITRALPYDRAATTMAGFAMCPECRREYEDPADRRFHAQPNACPACGPRARLLHGSGRELCAPGEDPVRHAARLLRQGAIAAVKGLGGYHLACDPFDAGAVRALRERKGRPDRPFALMAASLEQARELCLVGPEEETLLLSPARPIVLLERRPGGRAPAPGVAPRHDTLGVMLAYTPLHHLLLRDAGIPLVMTSGNRCDEPIAHRDGEARERLSSIADCFLVHDRPIHAPCDDGVTRVVRGEPLPLRRSRGAVPAPLRAGPFRRRTLACGGELKNTFCLGRGEHAFVGPHVGDLEGLLAAQAFQAGVEHFLRLFDGRPEVVACDLHPDYVSTRFARALAQREGLPVRAVQHHHAHVASCLAENGRPADERVIGVAMDGTGLGTDGTLWGGEFFTGSIREGFTRRAHLEAAPLPGGAAAIRSPWRAAVARLLALYGEEETLRLPLPLVRRAGERAVRQIARLVERRLNSPPSTGAGRLFDAAAALLGLPGTDRTTYEGQAAVELELAARATGETGGLYPVRLESREQGWIVATSPILAAMTGEALAGRPAGTIARRFHATLAAATAAACARLRDETGESAVALSGGTFQNALLLGMLLEELPARGFTVYRHRRVPPGDGGLCLGQAVLADAGAR